METVLVAVGTVTFAATGALTAVRRGFDLVGILILAFVTAVGGGSVRDLLVGTIPPSALTDERLLWLAFAAALAVAALHRHVPTGRALYALDTASLALFAALGAQRGLEAGFGLWGTVFAGVLSGVGGGIIRDVLSGEVPGVLYRSGDFYAAAAALGSVTAFLLLPVSVPAGLAAATAVTVTARVGSRLAGLELPVPRRAVD
jgi:uncharacterized membrane protein YeiH